MTRARAQIVLDLRYVNICGGQKSLSGTCSLPILKGLIFHRDDVMERGGLSSTSKLLLTE